jgi:predicted small integral membrane protein
VLADDRGLHVTLSHACPTAAALLVDATSPPAIVEAGDGCPVSGIADIGLDARGHWPPLLRPGVMMSLESWNHWERFAVATLGAGTSPFMSLARVRRAAERLAAWHPSLGPLGSHLQPVVECAASEPISPELLSWEEAVVCWRAVRGAVPAGRALPPELPSVVGRDESWVLDTIHRHVGPIGRYLAARSFASWMAYQGHGLRSFVASLRTALGALVVEMHRAAGGPRVQRDDVHLAIRRTDQLLVHLAEAAALARAWNRADADCIRP